MPVHTAWQQWKWVLLIDIRSQIDRNNFPMDMDQDIHWSFISGPTATTTTSSWAAWMSWWSAKWRDPKLQTLWIRSTPTHPGDDIFCISDQIVSKIYAAYHYLNSHMKQSQGIFNILLKKFHSDEIKYLHFWTSFDASSLYHLRICGRWHFYQPKYRIQLEMQKW